MNTNKEDWMKINAIRVETLYNNSFIPLLVTLTGCTLLFYYFMG